MRTLKVKAHAKINLYLRILGKRPDGYHAIETVFQNLELADEVVIEEGQSDLELKTSHPELPPGKENLIFKAVELLNARAGRRLGATISLEKKVPVAAGLAGGSADAAAALAGLNLLWELNLSPFELQEIGAEIGADVPFCLRGGTVLGKERGDKLETLPVSFSTVIVLAKPAFSISAKSLYQKWDEAGIPSSPSDASVIIEALSCGDKKKVSASLVNDLELVAVGLYPEIGRIKQLMLEAGGMGAQMSGSGPTVFALADSRETAERIAQSVNRICPYVMITKTYPRGLEIVD